MLRDVVEGQKDASSGAAEVPLPLDERAGDVSYLVAASRELFHRRPLTPAVFAAVRFCAAQAEVPVGSSHLKRVRVWFGVGANPSSSTGWSVIFRIWRCVMRKESNQAEATEPQRLFSSGCGIRKAQAPGSAHGGTCRRQWLLLMLRFFQAGSGEGMGSLCPC